MMKHVFTFLLLSVFYCAGAQTTINGSFNFDGETRTYSFYVPATYNAAQPVPLVLNLHGTGSSGDEQAQNRDLRPISDTANFIVVHPDGTTLFGQRFWNYGNVLGSTVDDVGFLEALIDTISASHSIDQNRVYAAGMSNGSFMCYYLACQTDRFAAIGAVTGSMGTTMYNECQPAHPTPTIHIHGTDDPINSYDGTSTSMSIPDVVRFWVDNNQCDTVPTITPVADIDTDDQATAERYLYSNGMNGNMVEHFKVAGGGHTWPGHEVFSLTAGNTCMDFDASLELWRFFSQYSLAATSSIDTHSVNALTIYPNPTADRIYVDGAGEALMRYTITDVSGRMMVNKAFINTVSVTSIDVGDLSVGSYLLTVETESGVGTRQFLKE